MKPARALGAAVFFLLASLSSGQEAEYVLRVDVPLVSFELVVLDPDGRPVTGLPEDQFEVLEDGEPREIRNFASVETPYSVLLLFDNMLPPAERTLMGSASNLFLEALRPQDFIAIASFDLEFRTLLEWRPVMTGEPVGAVVPAPPILGRKAFLRSLEEALGQFSEVSGRKGVIVLTDGNELSFLNATLPNDPGPPEDSATSFPELLDLLEAASIPFYFVAVPPVPPAARGLARSFQIGGREITLQPSGGMLPEYAAVVRSRLEELAQVSGGRVYFVEEAEDGLPLYEEIASELGRSYSIAFSPGSSTGTHSIEVRVSNPDFRVVQSRTSYTFR